MFIFDCEVFAYDWLFVFKEVETGEYTVIHNDNEAVKQFMARDPLLGGFNNKHYDNHILKAVLCDADPRQVKEINDFIILEGHNGWENEFLSQYRVYFESFDLMDDCLVGLSLKAIEAHLGIPIEESEVDFDIDRPLTEEELSSTIFYCKYDVDATELLLRLRKIYLQNKMNLGRECGLSASKALYMTNAKLTAAYLKAEQRPHGDEREYQYPKQLLRQYIPDEVFHFFDRLQDLSVPDEEVFSESLDIMVGECPCTIAYGGIHGAIPCYSEETSKDRTIRNKDVASYYPHLMTLMGYCSRNIPSPEVYAETIERRVAAKKAHDGETADALKLVLNTTYGAMLNQYNDLYDPLMGRSVCISGQLFLLELAEHLILECPTLKVIQLNTDGIMVSLDYTDEPKYQEITEEWQVRTGFELEEDFIRKIVQKDVNNYVEVPMKGDPKIKGGLLVRGVLTNTKFELSKFGLRDWPQLKGGAFKINNNANIVAKAIVDRLAYGTPVEQTINDCNEIFEFQMIAKAGGKYSHSFHLVNGEQVPVQKVNRVYAAPFSVEHGCPYGTLYKTHAMKGSTSKISGLPEHCIVDNNNQLTIEAVDKTWYIRLARKYVNDFLGRKGLKRNTRRVNSLKKKCLTLL